MKIFCESHIQENYFVVLLFANTDNCQIKTVFVIVNTEHVQKNENNHKRIRLT